MASGAPRALVAAIWCRSWPSARRSRDLATGAPAQGGARLAKPTAGVFTGRYANGVPVYLLPPVSVVAIRKTEIAKMEREEQRAHASYGRADDAAHRTN